MSANINIKKNILTSKKIIVKFKKINLYKSRTPQGTFVMTASNVSSPTIDFIALRGEMSEK